MSVYTTEAIDTDLFIPRDEVYLPGVPLTAQQLDTLEATKDEIERRTDLAIHHALFSAPQAAHTAHDTALARPASHLRRAS